MVTPACAEAICERCPHPRCCAPPCATRRGGSERPSQARASHRSSPVRDGSRWGRSSCRRNVLFHQAVHHSTGCAAGRKNRTEHAGATDPKKLLRAMAVFFFFFFKLGNSWPPRTPGQAGWRGAYSSRQTACTHSEYSGFFATGHDTFRGTRYPPSLQSVPRGEFAGSCTAGASSAGAGLTGGAPRVGLQQSRRSISVPPVLVRRAGPRPRLASHQRTSSGPRQGGGAARKAVSGSCPPRPASGGGPRPAPEGQCGMPRGCAGRMGCSRPAQADGAVLRRGHGTGVQRGAAAAAEDGAAAWDSRPCRSASALSKGRTWSAEARARPCMPGSHLPGRPRAARMQAPARRAHAPWAGLSARREGNGCRGAGR